MSELKINDKYISSLSVDEIKSLYNVVQKLVKRIYNHGSTALIDNKGRPKVSPEHKKEMLQKRQQKYKLKKNNLKQSKEELRLQELISSENLENLSISDFVNGRSPV